MDWEKFDVIMYFFKFFFRSSEKPGALCRPDGFLTLLHSSKLSSRGEIILIFFPSLRIMLSVLFMFNLLNKIILHNSVQMFLVQVTWNVSSRGIVCINTSVPDELLSLSRW